MRSLHIHCGIPVWSEQIPLTHWTFFCIKSLLQTTCKARGFWVLFIPKFHCKLNFIEQCWGYAKWIYHHYPTSSKEADLKHNVLAALESVPLESMWKWSNLIYFWFHMSNILSRFSMYSCCFMDAYEKGLNGKQAAWANKKYKGHHVIPCRIKVNLI